MTESAAHWSGHQKGRQHGYTTQSEPRASASGFSGATPASERPRAYAWGSDECRRKCHGPWSYPLGSVLETYVRLRLARNGGPAVTRPSLPSRNERLYGDPDIFGDLPQQNRGDIPTAMERYRCASTVRMTVLLVGASLSNLGKTQRLELGSHFPGFEDGKLCHLQATSTVWMPTNCELTGGSPSFRSISMTSRRFPFSSSSVSAWECAPGKPGT